MKELFADIGQQAGQLRIVIPEGKTIMSQSAWSFPNFMLEAISRSQSYEEEPKQSPAVLLSWENRVEEARAVGIFRDSTEKKSNIEEKLWTFAFRGLSKSFSKYESVCA